MAPRHVRVGDLVTALGADAGSQSPGVSRICADLDTEVAAFRDRSRAPVAFPYVFPGATYCKAGAGHRVVSPDQPSAEPMKIR
jgi:putative transposase